MYVLSVQILMRETRQAQTGYCSDNTVDGPSSWIQEPSNSSISNSNDLHILWIKMAYFRNFMVCMTASWAKHQTSGFRAAPWILTLTFFTVLILWVTVFKSEYFVNATYGESGITHKYRINVNTIYRNIFLHFCNLFLWLFHIIIWSQSFCT